MMRKHISIIGSQMDLGAFRKGVDMGPLAIRHADLIDRMRNAGYEVTDYGDVVPLVAEDQGNPLIRYQKEINESNRRLYKTVLGCHRCGEMPVVLGGDHSIAIGSISASLTQYKSVGIICACLIAHIHTTRYMDNKNKRTQYLWKSQLLCSSDFSRSSIFNCISGAPASVPLIR